NAVDKPDVDAQAARNLPVEDHRACPQPKPSPVQNRAGGDERDHAEDEQDDSVEGITHTGDVDRAADWSRNALITSARNQGDAFAGYQTQSPGCQQGVKRSLVQSLDHSHFDS